MKLSYVLPFAAITSAFVLPEAHVFNELQIENNDRHSWSAKIESKKEQVLAESKQLFGKTFSQVKEEVREQWNAVSESSQNAFDNAVENGSKLGAIVNDKLEDSASSIGSWIESGVDGLENVFDDHHHHGPHHPHEPHGKPNMTVYQLIASSKYSTKLAKLISEFDDLVEALNSTKANYTVFAPTDKAFDKIPEDAPKPTKEQLKAFLSYHVVPDYLPARGVLGTHTAPTLLKLDSLGGEAQRIAFRLGLKGLTVNFFSRVVAVNIFGTNGVIHGLDTPLVPPFSAIATVDLFPTTFSTLELGLGKTGLLDALNTTDHNGGTFFAPNNWAFKKLGPKINAFLFSKYGTKYLKALLEYHVVPERTLYTDAYYDGSSEDSKMTKDKNGYFHIDLPTLLEDRSLGVDIARYGPFSSIKVNGFTTVAVSDVVVEDGVIQVMTDVIIPPKKVPGSDDFVYWRGEEMAVEDFKERLEPFVAKTDL